ILIGKGIAQMRQQPAELFRAQRGRGSSAHIDCIELSSRHLPAHKRDLPAESVKIVIHALFPYLQRMGAEGTVQADARAERNSHIEAVAVLIVDFLQNL